MHLISLIYQLLLVHIRISGVLCSLSYLSENPFITAPKVNAIISSQQFAKSHFTSLRNKLVVDLNEKLFILTNNQKCIIETKHPEDNRVKVYKADASIIKKKISFLNFLIKR